MKGKKWILAKQFSGVPTEENIKLVEYELPDELKENEVLLQAVYLSVDPYMRVFPNSDNAVMLGEQLSEVIKTRNGQYPLGTLVLSQAGWQSHYISTGEGLTPISFDIGSTPKSYTLGTLGMTGATAYIGLNKCEPKKGDIVLVSGAAGAVGHVVGQLAKIQGCTVIGFVGSDEKVDWCKNELHFDHVFNYKKVNLSEAINSVAPDGVDIYFDNVGGDFFHTILNKHMRMNGRIMTIGSIQTYNDTETRSYQTSNVPYFMKNLTVRGLYVFLYANEWPQAFTEMNKLIQEGKLKVREQVYTGIEHMRDAFLGLFKGENLGKAIVKAVNAQTNYP